MRLRMRITSSFRDGGSSSRNFATSVDVRVLVDAMRVSGHPAFDLRSDLFRELDEGLRCRRIRVHGDDRLAAVAAYDDLRIDRHFAEERHASHLRRFLAAAVAEDLRPLPAVRG